MLSFPVTTCSVRLIRDPTASSADGRAKYNIWNETMRCLLDIERDVKRDVRESRGKDPRKETRGR